MWSRVLALSLALGACGRFGFDGSSSVDDAVVLPDVSSIDGSVVVTSSAIEVVPPPFRTNSTTYVDVPGGSFEIPAAPNTKWLLLVSGAIESASFDATATTVRYLVDGVERGIGGTESAEIGRPGPWQHFDVIDGGTAPIVVSFQLRDLLGADSTLSHLRAVAVKLPAGADPLFASSDPGVSVVWTANMPIATLALTPASAGDYVVLLTAVTDESPSSNNIFTQWLAPDGMPWTQELQMPRQAAQTHFYVRRTTLTGPTTIVLQGRAGTNSVVSYTRVLALRTDAFSGTFDMASTLTPQESTSTTPIESVVVAPSLSPASAYVALGTMRIEESCDGMGTIATRGAHFSVDEWTQDIYHAPGNCAYETTYGMVRLVQSPPSRVAGAFSSGNAVNVRMYEGSVLVLGVP